jgi:3-polyprenyl-4-hydroxybenzoate decarboxylase
MPDPSLPHRGLSTKMVIDATQQFAQENGPPSWPPLNRDLLEEQCPDLMDLVDEKWSQHWRKR